METSAGIRKASPFLLNDFQIVLTAKLRKAPIYSDDGDIRSLENAFEEIIGKEKINHESHINK
jgi:hypothetical protein